MTRKFLCHATTGLMAACLALIFAGQTQAQIDGLVLRLRADNYDDSTGRWTDTSGQGHDMIQPNSSDLVRPTKVTGQTPNGNSVVRFGQQDWMRLDVPTIDDWIYSADRFLDAEETVVNPKSGVTFFAYVKPEDRSGSTDAPDGRFLISGQAGSPSLLFKKDGRQRVEQQSTARLGEALEVSREYGCYSAGFDREGGFMRLNGEFSGDLGSTDVIQPNVTRAWGPIYALGFNSFPNAGFLGDVAEIRIYDRKLTQAEIEAVEAELCAAYDEDPNTAPTADAGENQSVRAGDVVLLDGGASFDDNTVSADLVYEWSFTSKPSGSTATLDDSTSQTPSFASDVAGTYALELVVTDEAGLESLPATVEISTENLAPTAVAEASHALAIVNEALLFSGLQSSDPEGDDITYEWSIFSAPLNSTATLVDNNTSNPTLTPDVEGSYVLCLVASDFLGPSEPTYIEVTATSLEDFAEILILDASDIVEGLERTQVRKRGLQRLFVWRLKIAICLINAGKEDCAIWILNRSIARTDGCPLRGTPDSRGRGRDWITDCTAQQEVYDLLTLAVDTLEGN